ncbi:MAG TPA: ABC transporter permease, partial [Jatrophihabitans sp.]|nr:ABC transporter permease [Jatrophihabitans sp.]
MRLALRMVIRRPAAVLATFLAALFAAGMVTTCGALLESGLRYHGTVARYAATPVVVATTDVRTEHVKHGDTETTTASLDTPRRLPNWLVGALRRLPEVRSVVADASVPVLLSDPADLDVPVALHPWSAAALAPYRLTSGRAPAGAQLVLDRQTADREGVTVGDRMRLWTATGPRQVEVAGIAAASGNTDPSVFVDNATSRTLAGATPQVVGVLPRSGVSTADLAAAVQGVLTRHGVPATGAQPHVYTGADRGRAETPGVVQTREWLIVLSSVFGGSTLLVCAFVIANTVGLSVRQRLRDIALLRAVAATPGQVRRMVTGEAIVVGALAAIAGLALGRFGIDRLRAGFVAHGLAPAGFHAEVAWLPALVAAAATVLIGAVAAWVAALRSSRVRPTTALAETLVEPSGLGVFRVLAGLVALAGGIVICVVAAKVPAAAPGVAVATITTLTLAAALLGPLLLRLVAATVGQLARVVGVPGQLSAASLATAARRTSPVLTGLVLAIALVGGMWFVLTTEDHVAGEQVADGLRAEQVVIPPEPGLAPGVAARLAATPGLTATPVVHGTLLIPYAGDIDQRSVQGVDVRGLDRTLDLDVTAGNLARLRGSAVAVDALTARDLHLHVGSSVHGWLGDGSPTVLRVVAIYSRGLGFADFTFARSTLAPHTATGLDSAVYLAGSPAALERARTKLTGAAPPGTKIVSAGQYRVGLSADRVANAWANQVIVAVLLGYVALAAVNTLIVHTAARRREFGVLRLSGTTPRQVLLAVTVEHALLLGTALVLGIGIGAAALLPSVHAVTGSARPYLPPVDW